MPVVPLTAPYSMKNAILSIAADDFTAAVTGVVFNPTTQSSTLRFIGGTSLTDQSVATWLMELGYAQDLAPTGLARYLLDHEGEEAAVVLSPVGVTGPNVLATVVLSPGAIGATADGNTAVATSSMGCQSAPTFDDTP